MQNPINTKIHQQATALIMRSVVLLVFLTSGGAAVYAQGASTTTGTTSGTPSSIANVAGTPASDAGTDNANPGTAWNIRKDYFLRFPVARQFGPKKAGGKDVITNQVSQGTSTTPPGVAMVIHSNPGNNVYSWPIVIPAASSRVPTYRDTAIDDNLFQTFGYPVSDTQFQIIQRYNDNRMLEQLFDPEKLMWMNTATSSIQATSAANSAGDMTTNQTQSAIDFTRKYLTNFTAEPGNRWQNIRDKLSIPIAVLLLLVGAVATQVKAIVAAGNPVLGEANPFEGIQRSIIAIAMIPGTALIMGWGIDFANSITFTIADEYRRLFGTDMYVDAQCAEQRAFPINTQSSDLNAMIQQHTSPAAVAAGGNPSNIWGVFEQHTEMALHDPCAGINTSTTPDEQAKQAQSIGRLLMNGVNMGLSAMWNVLCAFMMAFLYYLWVLGPIVSSLWVWPMQRLRAALGSWTDGVIILCFWPLFWNVDILLMACFKGSDGQTGTIIMTALNALSTISVKYAFDFTNLVTWGAAPSMMQAMTSKAGQSTATGSPPGGGAFRQAGSSAQSLAANPGRAGAMAGAQNSALSHASPGAQALASGLANKTAQNWSAVNGPGLSGGAGGIAAPASNLMAGNFGSGAGAPGAGAGTGGGAAPGAGAGTAGHITPRTQNESLAHSSTNVAHPGAWTPPPSASSGGTSGGTPGGNGGGTPGTAGGATQGGNNGASGNGASGQGNTLANELNNLRNTDNAVLPTGPNALSGLPPMSSYTEASTTSAANLASNQHAGSAIPTSTSAFNASGGLPTGANEQLAGLPPVSGNMSASSGGNAGQTAFLASSASNESLSIHALPPSTNSQAGMSMLPNANFEASLGGASHSAPPLEAPVSTGAMSMLNTPFAAGAETGLGTPLNIGSATHSVAGTGGAFSAMPPLPGANMNNENFLSRSTTPEATNVTPLTPSGADHSSGIGSGAPLQERSGILAQGGAELGSGSMLQTNAAMPNQSENSLSRSMTQETSSAISANQNIMGQYGSPEGSTGSSGFNSASAQVTGSAGLYNNELNVTQGVSGTNSGAAITGHSEMLAQVGSGSQTVQGNLVQTNASENIMPSAASPNQIHSETFAGPSLQSASISPLEAQTHNLNTPIGDNVSSAQYTSMHTSAPVPGTSSFEYDSSRGSYPTASSGNANLQYEAGNNGGSGGGGAIYDQPVHSGQLAQTAGYSAPTELAQPPSTAPMNLGNPSETYANNSTISPNYEANNTAVANNFNTSLNSDHTPIPAASGSYPAPVDGSSPFVPGSFNTQTNVSDYGAAATSYTAMNSAPVPGASGFEVDGGRASYVQPSNGTGGELQYNNAGLQSSPFQQDLGYNAPIFNQPDIQYNASAYTQYENAQAQQQGSNYSESTQAQQVTSNYPDSTQIQAPYQADSTSQPYQTVAQSPDHSTTDSGTSSLWSYPTPERFESAMNNAPPQYVDQGQSMTQYDQVSNGYAGQIDSAPPLPVNSQVATVVEGAGAAIVGSAVAYSQARANNNNESQQPLRTFGSVLSAAAPPPPPVPVPASAKPGQQSQSYARDSVSETDTVAGIHEMTSLQEMMGAVQSGAESDDEKRKRAKKLLKEQGDPTYQQSDEEA